MNLQAVLLRVRAALLRRGRSVHEAEDLVQEAWVRLAQYERGQVVAKPEAFLMRAALNLSVDAHRSRLSHGEEVLVEDVVLIDPTPNAEAIILARERVDRLYVCLNRLTEQTRGIFLSHRVDGLTYEEIARCHGLSISTVAKHVAKATLLVTTWMEGW